MSKNFDDIKLTNYNIKVYELRKQEWENKKTNGS